MVLGIRDAMSSIVNSAISTVTSHVSPERTYRDALSGTTHPPVAPVILHPQLADAAQKICYWQRKFSETDEALKALRSEADEVFDRQKKAQADLSFEKVSNSQLSQENATLRTKCNGLKAQLADAMKEREQEAKGLRKELIAHAETREALQSLQAENDETLRELQSLRTAQRNMESLLETRSSELRDAQAYLSKTDKISHAEVQRMVDGLNAQNFQLAALVADSFSYGKGRVCGDELQTAYERVEQRIGQPATDLLLSTLHQDDPMWVQMGLQAVATLAAAVIIHSWDVRISNSSSNFLTKIHTKVYAGEPQAISAKWRILLRRYVKQLKMKVDGVDKSTNHILSLFKNVLVVSGALGVEESACWEGILREKVVDFVTEGIKLQQAIGEDITSCDFQIICPDANTAFAAASMEDVEDCGRRKRQETVKGTPIMCTTEMGLRKCEKLTGEGGKPDSVRNVILIKAKVALQTV